MNESLVSILMPVKNAAPFLESCLNSIIEQSYVNWELLAVNDGSTDESSSLLRSYGRIDKRIHVFENEGQGIIPALQLAYQKSTGQYVTRMDADDVMHIKKLEELVGALLERGQGYVAIGQVQYFSEGTLGEGYKRYEAWLNQLTSRGDNFSDIYKECVIPSPCWMIGRNDLDMCQAFSSDLYPEDYDLCFRFYEGGLTCIPSNSILHYWRDHSSRSSRTDPNYADNRFLELKARYFIRIDLNKKRPCIIWGAGKKGKHVAQIFNRNNIAFSWVCDNPKKIGHIIYDVSLASDRLIPWQTNPQIIVTVANIEEQKDIIKRIEAEGAKKGVDYFLFC
jgi:glycosyltransferase involved in cell wall biosynthesis